jgi:hypothetical protein
VFSVQGNYVISQASCYLNLFKNASTLSNASFVNTVAKNMYNYPNPCAQTTIVLPKVTECQCKN